MSRLLYSIAFVLLLLVSSNSFGHDPFKAANADGPGHRPLCAIKPDGSELRVIADLGIGRSIGSARISSDGKFVAFDSWVPATDRAAASADLYVVQWDGKSLRKVCRGSMPTWAPKDQQLTFFRHGRDFGLWVVGKDGRGLEQLNLNGNSPRWSPDGKRIAFIQRGNGGGQIAIHEPQNGTDQVITPIVATLSYRHGFDWSPDGKRLCAQCRFQNEQQIRLINSSTGEHTVRYRKPTGVSLSWSPDGEKILFWQVDDSGFNQLYVLDPDSDDPPTRLPGLPRTRDNADATWSPDGQWIVFTSGVTRLGE